MSTDAKSVDRRIKRALARAAKPRWRRCFWTWPFGHQYERGRYGREPITCKWCGKPYTVSGTSVYDLITAAESATGVDLDDGLIPEKITTAWRAERNTV